MEPTKAISTLVSDTPKTWDQCSAGLRRLLTEGEDGGASVKLIAVNPALRAQAEAMLPALEAAKVEADRLDVLKILIRMAPVYALPPRPDGEWKALFEAYLDALDGFSAYQIEDAFRRWNRGEDMKDPAMGQFYPKPAQLVHLANKAKTEVWMAAYRARKALEHVEAQPRQVSPEERETVAAGLRELAATFKPKSLPSDMRPRLTPQEVAAKLREGPAPEEEPVL